MFEDLSARSKLDGEEIARLQKERDELLQRNAAVNEKASEVLKELEMERELRREAESRATALQQKVDEDVEVVRSLWAELGDAVSQRLSAENVSIKLEKRLPMHEGPFRLRATSTIFYRLRSGWSLMP